MQKEFYVVNYAHSQAPVSANGDGGNFGGSSRAAAAANGNMASDRIAVFISADIIPKKFLLCLAAESFHLPPFTPLQRRQITSATAPSAV